MDTPPSLPPELWERILPEVQADIRALEERIVLFEAMVHAFQEQVRTLGRNEMDPPLCGSTSMSHNEFTIRDPI
jgi:citrate lyase synthetase